MLSYQVRPAISGLFIYSLHLLRQIVFLDLVFFLVSIASVVLFRTRWIGFSLCLDRFCVMVLVFPDSQPVSTERVSRLDEESKRTLGVLGAIEWKGPIHAKTEYTRGRERAHTHIHTPAPVSGPLQLPRPKPTTARRAWALGGPAVPESGSARPWRTCSV